GVCALLALMETPMALVLPVIVLAYDLWLKPAGKRKDTRAPFITFGIILISIFAGQVLLSWWLGGHGLSRPESWELAPAAGDWPLRFLRDWPAGVLAALRWAVVPEPFTMDYAVTPAAWYETLGGWIIASSLVLAIWAQSSRRPALAFGLTWLLAAAAVAAACVFRHCHGAILEQPLYTLGIGIALVVGFAIESAGRFEPRGTRRWIEAGGLAVGALALLGWANYRAADWSSEPKILDATLRQQPSSGLAHLQLGRLYLDAKRVAEAEKCFLRAAAANWNYYELYGNLGETALVKKEYARAEKCYREALALNPDSSGARFHLGHALFGQKRYAEARECYQELLAKSPRSPTLYQWVANTYEAEDRTYEANQALEQAKRLLEEERERLKAERRKAAE
ncbi:MAG: tetratricopeptide repeat protein, partial [Verrucomicrobia bacterium]|nr:tetratricopeptide repeat protein [Verrucomicrobiota bacterium]